MGARGFGWTTAALAVFAIGACGPRPLDPNGGTGIPPTSSDDVASALRRVSGPGVFLIVASNAGAVANAPDGANHVFEKDPGTLVAAAATVGMSVCSVEPYTLVTSDTSPPPSGVTVAVATDICRTFDLGDMVAQLSSLKAMFTVVIVAANTGITVRTANGGINYFYDTDILRLWRAARTLYIPVCVIVPDALAIATYTSGQTMGVSVDDALARCGL